MEKLQNIPQTIILEKNSGADGQLLQEPAVQRSAAELFGLWQSNQPVSYTEFSAAIQQLPPDDEMIDTYHNVAYRILENSI